VSRVVARSSIVNVVHFEELFWMMTKILALCVGFALVTSTANAASTTSISRDAPDLTSVKAKVKAKDYVGALAELKPMLETHHHADVYNLMGFSLRKTGDIKQGGEFYVKALDLDPNHLGALEYQGQMFVELGQLAKAKTNLKRLVALCPSGCEEREDLEKAIAKAPAAKKK
jgi:tetratricopeptide (TPR) repeat protein